MTIYFASLRLCVKLGSQSREDAKISKDYICEKYSTTNLFCEMVLFTDSHNYLYNITNVKKKMRFNSLETHLSNLYPAANNSSHGSKCNNPIAGMDKNIFPRFSFKEPIDCNHWKRKK